MEYKKLLLEPLHRTEAISMTLQEILSENNLNTALLIVDIDAQIIEYNKALLSLIGDKEHYSVPI